MTRQTVAAVPDALWRLARTERLGQLHVVHPPKRMNWIALIGLFLVGLITTICLIGFYILWLAVRTPNVSPSQARKRIYVFDEGFVHAADDATFEVYRFDQVRTVFQKIVVTKAYGVVTTNTSYLYTITRLDGRTIKLTQFWEGIDDLGPLINNRVSSALLPPMRSAIAAGQGVRFGDVTLTRDDVTGKRRTVPWTQIKSVTIAAGYVRVNVAGKFLSLSSTPAAKIPNLPLFLTLAAQLRRGT